MGLSDSIEGGNQLSEVDAITEEDLIAFALDDATDDQRRRVGVALEDPQSYASQWMDRLCARFSDPFGVEIGSLSDNDEAADVS